MGITLLWKAGQHDRQLPDPINIPTLCVELVRSQVRSCIHAKLPRFLGIDAWDRSRERAFAERGL